MDHHVDCRCSPLGVGWHAYADVMDGWNTSHFRHALDGMAVHLTLLQHILPS